MSGRLLARFAVVVCLAMLVAGVPAVASSSDVTDIDASVLSQVDTAASAAAAVAAQLPGSKADDDPSPRPVREVPDPDVVDSGPAPEWTGFELATGKRSADVAVGGGRVAVAGTPFAVRVEDGALSDAGRVEVNVTPGQLRSAGQLSDLFTVDFVDTEGSKMAASKTPTLEVDVSSVPEGVWGDLATRLTVNWYENCTPRDRVIDEDTKSTRSYVACERVVPLEKSLDLEERVLSVELDVPPALGVIERGVDTGGNGAAGAAGGGFWMAYAGGSSGFGIGGDLESGAGS